MCVFYKHQHQTDASDKYCAKKRNGKSTVRSSFTQTSTAMIFWWKILFILREHDRNDLIRFELHDKLIAFVIVFPLFAFLLVFCVCALSTSVCLSNLMVLLASPLWEVLSPSILMFDYLLPRSTICLIIFVDFSLRFSIAYLLLI